MRILGYLLVIASVFAAGGASSSSVVINPHSGDVRAPFNPACGIDVAEGSVVMCRLPARQTVPIGQAPTWTITISNAYAGLANVALTDPDAPGCNRTVPLIAKGTTYTYTCTGPIVLSSAPRAYTLHWAGIHNPTWPKATAAVN